MLEVRGIEFVDGNGVIILRIGSSPSAPHGVGPNAYVRRGSNSEPLTMRDMQSMFYERRTRLERISQLARDQSIRADAIANNWRSGLLIHTDSNQAVDNSTGLAFHLSLISSEDLGIDNLPDLIRAKRQKSPAPNLNSIVDFPSWTDQWKRGYRSISRTSGYSRNLSNIEISAVGVITISNVNVDNKFHPAWYSKIIVQAFLLAEWLRRWRGRPDIEFILHGKFEKVGDPPIPSHNGTYETWISIPWQSASIDPYSIASRAGFPTAHDVIEREIWNLFAAERDSGLVLKWDELFESV